LAQFLPRRAFYDNGALVLGVQLRGCHVDNGCCA